ncbi:MAG TPA: hypothetical protein VKN64_01610 [Halanaerobiales bacterium]|nr:hypothetical protein [Halanaerobiales bacterium]
MGLKKAKTICKLQGISFNLEVVILCPYCGNKSMRLIIRENTAECYRCNKKQSIDDILEITKSDWSEKHKKYEKLMRFNRGVDY